MLRLHRGFLITIPMNKRPLINGAVLLMVTMAVYHLVVPLRTQQETAPSPAGGVAHEIKKPAAISWTKETVVARASSLKDHSTAKERVAVGNELAQAGAGSEPLLASALHDVPSLAGKGAVADAIARIGTSEAVDALLGALASTSDAAERATIVRAFDALPPGQPLETLASSLVTALDPVVRDGVVATIARAADGSTVQFLTEMYREPEAFTGQSANVLAALGSIHNPEAAEALKALLITNHEVAVMEAVVSSLAKIGTPDALQAISISLETLGATNPALRTRMLATLQAVENPAALEWLQKTAAASPDDPDLAKAAAAAVASINKSMK